MEDNTLTGVLVADVVLEYLVKLCEVSSTQAAVEETTLTSVVCCFAEPVLRLWMLQKLPAARALR